MDAVRVTWETAMGPDNNESGRVGDTIRCRLTGGMASQTEAGQMHEIECGL